MDGRARRQVIEYVRPLAVGLDGVTNFGDAERVVAASQRIASDRPDLDSNLVFLLALFSGQERWVSRMGHRSRTEIFLASIGVDEATIRALFRALSRFESAPRTAEEKIVHDAVALERLGAFGIARMLVESHRERLEMREIAAAVEAAAQIPFATEAARALAEPRRQIMRDFARALRDEVEEFEKIGDL